MRTILIGSIFSLITACTSSSWSEVQFSEGGSTEYLTKNADGDGFFVREQIFGAVTAHFTEALDSGGRYPFELYLIGKDYVMVYKALTPEWYNPHGGILLVEDVNQLFKDHPQLAVGMKSSEKMMLILKHDERREEELFRFTAHTTGARNVFEGFTDASTN